eukprot:g8588.t1
MQCAEIYGHVYWEPWCDCVDAATGQANNITQAEPRTGVANIYFSVPAFVVLFRESLEVVIVLAIILQFLQKMKQDGLMQPEQYYKFRREVYVGAGLGFALCLCFGVGFLALASLTYQLFEGDNERIFQFCMMMLTSAVLTFLAVNFYKMIFTKDPFHQEQPGAGFEASTTGRPSLSSLQEAHERKMKAQMEATLEATREAETGSQVSFGRRRAFFVLAFTTGLREGLESIVFLVGVITDVNLGVEEMLILFLGAPPGFMAQLIAALSTKKVRVDWFMRGSAILLMFIAAGFFSASMHQLQELDVFGIWSPRSERPWQNVTLGGSVETDKRAAFR